MKNEGSVPPTRLSVLDARYIRDINDAVKASHIDWGTGPNQVNSDDFVGTEWTDLTDGGDTILHGHDHDTLTNFVANKHIDHTAVTLTAGTGLSGGGDISANRTFAVDLNELTTEASIAAGDFLAMVDITDDGSGKITFANLEATIDHVNIQNIGTNTHAQIDTFIGTTVPATYLQLDCSNDPLTAELETQNIHIPDSYKLYLGTGKDGEVYSSSDDLYIENVTQDKDIIFRINDGGVQTEVMRIDGNTSRVGIGTIDFADEVADKIYLWNTTFGIGISSGELNQWVTANSDFSWRTDTREGTEIMELDTATGNLKLLTGELDVDGTGTNTMAGDLDIEGNILMADDKYIGISGAERIIFDTAGDIEIMGANVGIGTTGPATPGLHILAGTQASDPALLRVQSAETASTNFGDVYAGIEFGISGGENGSGAQEVTTYIKTIDTRAGATSYDDGGLVFGTLNTSGGPTDRMVITHEGNVGIGTTDPQAKLHVDQASSTGAIPVLSLDQADISDGFINYIGTSAASAAGPISSWTAGNSIQGFVRVEINEAQYWMPYYDAPTS